MNATTPKPSLEQLQEQYQAVLPAIETHGRIYFRHLRCPHQKADAVQEMRALGWLWLLRLAGQGKDVQEFISTFVTLLARAVNSGRKLVGMNKAKDVLNPAAQKRRGFQVERLPAGTRLSLEQRYGMPHGQEQQDAFEQRLQDNTVTPVPEQVSFRLDFPAWRRTRTRRDRHIMDALMAGESTTGTARRHGLSTGRVSQLRREFLEDWLRFCDELPVGGLPV